jgi:hypothetical protein
MAIQCSESVLTGQDGSVWLKPAGTEHCLEDLTDFPAGPGIVNVPVEHDFRAGDPIVFNPEGGKLDTGLQAGRTYYVGLTTPKTIQVLATKGGAPVELEGDGGAPPGSRGAVATFGSWVPGSGYQPGTYQDVPLQGGLGKGAKADITVGVTGVVTAVSLEATAKGTGYQVGDILTALTSSLGGTGSGFQVPVATITAQATNSPGGHINVTYSEYAAVCQVSSYSINMTREQLDTTSLPCGIGKSQGKYASFRTQQAGYASGDGSMTVRFTYDQTGLANRLLANSMLRSQAGAWVKLYVNTVSDGDLNNPMPDDVESSYIEAPISIQGMDLNVTPDQPTEATLNFSLAGTPKRIFSVDL